MSLLPANKAACGESGKGDVLMGRSCLGKLGARLHRHQIARSAARTPSHAGQFLRSQWETEPMAQPAMDR